jgi:hypothetical protein
VGARYVELGRPSYRCFSGGHVFGRLFDFCNYDLVVLTVTCRNYDLCEASKKLTYCRYVAADSQFAKCSSFRAVGKLLGQTVGVPLMPNWQLRIRGVGYIAVEFAVGLASIVAVMAIAKYGL